MTKQKTEFFVADPAGNITIMVVSPVKRKNYAKVAKQLLALEEYKGEQVGFIREKPEDADGSMEMCGLEFCGNAGRSFALYLAGRGEGHPLCTQEAGSDERELLIRVSGSDKPVRTIVNPKNSYAGIFMPLPKKIDMVVGSEDDELNGSIVVDFEGITHMILEDVKASDETFEKVKKYINREYNNPPCIGAMFYDIKNDYMVPVVYVRDVDTTYYEGSCGSGTCAAGISRCVGRLNDTYRYEIKQPRGSLTVAVTMQDGRPAAVSVEGTVKIGDIHSVDIEI
ncbi:MAG: hypothetical protein K6F52_04715 [Clostridia bacterium]|nr:hypothetical protein [Clostridia bacterium]